MVVVLPRAETFGSKFAEALSKGVENGANAYNKARDLKRQGQEQSGTQGLAIFNSLIKDATPEEQANFFKQSADSYKRGEAPQDRLKKLADMATGYKNKLTNIEEGLEPEKWSQKFSDIWTGDSKESRYNRGEVARKGLNELPIAKQRDILAKKGFTPEAIASKTSPLSKEASEFFKGIPDMKPFQAGNKYNPDLKKGSQPTSLPENQKEYIGKELASFFEKNPDANPLLVRKELEDKGVNWRDYQDMIKTLEDSGQLKIDPYYQSYLSRPPLGPLREILHGIGIVER